MDREKWSQRLLAWLVMRPVYLAYRLIWLAARTGHADPRAVYWAMWDAQLDLPRLAQRRKPAKEGGDAS